jgi:hypothetical protein
MFAESALRIELHRRGAIEVLEIQADRALLGSGAHCDLRLAPDEAAVEQLTIEARDEEVYATVRALEPACRLNGAPFLEGRLSPDSLLELGGVTLRVTIAELKDAAQPAKKKASSQTHPAVQALGLLGVAAGLYYVLDKPVVEQSALAQPVSPPALFAEPAQRCPQRDAEAARSLAEQERADAESKAERAPFYPSDGLTAVQLYERSAACHEQVGDAQAAREARDAAAVLKRQLGDELHIRHVRLERFLAQAKYDEVWREVQMVSEFVRDKSHPYAHWLSAVKREIAIHNHVQKEGG